MYILLLFLWAFFLIPTFVFSSSTGGTSYNMVEVTTQINNIDGLLDDKNKALADFLKDDSIWKNSEGKFNKNDPGILNVLNEVGKVLCEGPEPCMVNYQDPNFVSNYILLRGACYQQLSNFDTALKQYQHYEGQPPGLFVLETYMKHIYKVMETYKDLSPVSWLSKRGNRFISMDELRLHLSMACLQLLRGNLKPVFKDSLKKAFGIPITGGPNKDGDGNKGASGNSQPLPLGMKIVLFGALPLVFLVIIGIVIYRLKFK